MAHNRAQEHHPGPAARGGQPRRPPRGVGQRRRRRDQDLRSGLNTLLAREWWDGAAFSPGQWQRVAVARAAHRDAGLLVMDEPTSDLDARAEHRIFTGLRELAGDRAVVLVTHNLANTHSLGPACCNGAMFALIQLSVSAPERIHHNSCGAIAGSGELTIDCGFHVVLRCGKSVLCRSFPGRRIRFRGRPRHTRLVHPKVSIITHS
ncbi:ATP-binding cassette domain-containing protein [Streptomyces lydicus]|uniref:ATP-binding cassette domain-containing protein n=1 Tax=Streptomyces lydicus TaxID=47763 RepID=UPI00379EEDFF